MGMKVYINNSGHMTKMATMPIYDKNLYFHDIQTSSSLKLLGQSKPNFIQGILRKGEQKYI